MTPPLPALRVALEAAVRDLGVEEVPELELARARNARHGDYSSSVPMKLARPLRRAPAQIAEELADRLDAVPEASVEPVGGYLNFHLRPQWLRELVSQASADEAYGASQLGLGQQVNVEFASINPTGPLHIGHGRGAILGDALCRLLEFTGHVVAREYYVNDENTQSRKFGASVEAFIRGQEPPEGGYSAPYVRELAEDARRDLPGLEEQPEGEAEPRLRHYAIERMVERLAATLERVRVHYDRWLFESSLWEEGLPQRAIEQLRESGQLVDRAGAVWFAPTVPGWEDSDEERVVIRASGEPTYFASDLGYLLSKFVVRGFPRGVVVWGADHHGYIPRIKGAMAALGLDPGRLVVILNQLVNLREGRMSKRQGRFVTLDELVDMVGVDPVRYFYLMRSPEAMMEFDLELAQEQGNENPVYYAQYAHARLFNVERTAAESHARLPERPDLDLLVHPWELDLAREIAFWPDAVETAARLLEPHRLPYYVHDLADRVHGFYHAGNQDGANRVVVEDAELTRARLELCRAARNTLRISLGLMGVSAPERM